MIIFMYIALCSPMFLLLYMPIFETRSVTCSFCWNFFYVHNHVKLWIKHIQYEKLHDKQYLVYYRKVHWQHRATPKQPSMTTIHIRKNISSYRIYFFQDLAMHHQQNFTKNIYSWITMDLPRSEKKFFYSFSSRIKNSWTLNSKLHR